MNFLSEDNKKKKANWKVENRKGNVIVIVTKADILAWNFDPSLLSSDQNQPIEDARSFVTMKSFINPYLLNLFVDSVDQSRWRVIQNPAFYSQLGKRFSIIYGSYLFIFPASPSVESVQHTSLFNSFHRTFSNLSFPCSATLPASQPPFSSPLSPTICRIST